MMILITIFLFNVPIVHPSKKDEMGLNRKLIPCNTVSQGNRYRYLLEKKNPKKVLLWPLVNNPYVDLRNCL